MSKLNLGDAVPVFSVKDFEGKKISNEILLGKNYVIFFYPKDDSPICTQEACSFRDTYEEFLRHNCEVIGVSEDTEESHKKFSSKHKLKYSLISAPKNELRKFFQVPKSFLGLLSGRVTYLVDKKGVIRLIFNSQLNANKHIDESLNFLKKYLSN
jgi:peroxiredoxin Q/BCP